MILQVILLQHFIIKIIIISVQQILDNQMIISNNIDLNTSIMMRNEVKKKIHLMIELLLFFYASTVATKKAHI